MNGWNNRRTMKTQFQTTNNVCTVVTAHLHLVKSSGEQSVSFSLVVSASRQTPDCFPNSIPALSAGCFTLTFLHAHVLGDGRGAATSSNPSVCLSSRSKHGPLHLFHSQGPRLHCKQIWKLNKALKIVDVTYFSEPNKISWVFLVLNYS